MNWHGKALGDKAEAAIKAIEAGMVEKNGPYKASRPIVVDDAQHYAPETILLSEPPSYKMGEKVCLHNVEKSLMQSGFLILKQRKHKNLICAICCRKMHRVN